MSAELRIKENRTPSPKDKSPSGQIDDIIKSRGDWRSKTLSLLRASIKKADPPWRKK
jgi:hypothetical protein